MARITKNDLEIIRIIAIRAQRAFFNAGVERDLIDCQMDLEAAHMDTPLDLQRLAAADDSNFAHDIGGIARHLNRETGKLEGCFMPRYAQSNQTLTARAN
jgi:hypothetical protein